MRNYQASYLIYHAWASVRHGDAFFGRVPRVCPELQPSTSAAAKCTSITRCSRLVRSTPRLRNEKVRDSYVDVRRDFTHESMSDGSVLGVTSNAPTKPRWIA
jgi:hypothetical protein